MFRRATMIATLSAVDIDRADHFYREVLGFERVYLDDPGAEGALNVYQAADGTKLALYQRGPTQADHTVITFIVDNISAVVDDLAAKGVRFEQYDFPGLKTDARGIAGNGQSRSAWMRDPEGNLLGITQLPPHR